MTRSADAKTETTKKEKGRNHPKKDLKGATHKLLARDDESEQAPGAEIAADAFDEHDPNYVPSDEEGYGGTPKKSSAFGASPAKRDGHNATGSTAGSGGARRRFSSFGEDSSMLEKDFLEQADADEEEDGETQWSLGQFQRKTHAILDEHLASHSRNISSTVSEIVANEKFHQFGDEFVNLAFRKGLDHRDKEEGRLQMEEMIVTYFRAVDWNRRNSLVRGIEKLLCTWEDLALDAPNAPAEILGLMERCIREELLTREILRKLPEQMLTHLVGKGKGFEHLNATLSELRTFKQAVERGLHDYFKTKQVSSVTYFLKELHQPDFHHEFVKKAICMAFDTSKDPEAIFSFIYELYMGNHIDLDAVQWGIIRVLGALEDLKLDFPRAPEFLTGLLVHFVKNDVLSAVFLKRCRLLRIGQASALQTLQAIEKKMPDYFKKYLGMADTKYELKVMILEYFDSGDKVEVAHLIREMDLSPRIAGEVVRKIMMYSMERSGVECEDAVALLNHLVNVEQELSRDAIAEGFRQLYHGLDDFCLDVPDAREMTEVFWKRCVTAGITDEAAA